jgi:hypothetical protein
MIEKNLRDILNKCEDNLFQTGDMNIDEVIEQAKQSGLIQPEKSCESCDFYLNGSKNSPCLHCKRKCADLWKHK